MKLRKYLLKERETGMFVGSHSKRHAQLQEREYAYEFSSHAEAIDSFNMLRDLPFNLEIILEGCDV
jgi:hypothetical protein